MRALGNRVTVLLLASFLGLATSLLITFVSSSYGMREALAVIAISVVFAYPLGNLLSRLSPQLSAWTLSLLSAGIPLIFAARGLLFDDEGTPAWILAAVAIFISVYAGIRVQGSKNAA